MMSDEHDTRFKSNQIKETKGPTRNKHLLMMNQLRKREEEWDGRFYLHDIPKYHFGEDKFCESYRQNVNPKFRVKKFAMKTKGGKSSEQENYQKLKKELMQQQEFLDGAPGENKVKREEAFPREIKSRSGTRQTPSALKRMHSNHETPQEMLEAERRDYEEHIVQMWEQLKLPQFHRDVYLQVIRGGNSRQVIDILKREIDALQTNRAAIQATLRSILAREACLKVLSEMIHSMMDAEESQQSDELALNLITKSSELLTHLRILSLNAVECIQKWRETIQNIYYSVRGIVGTGKTLMIPFLFNELNYLLKMKSDTKNLVYTPLSRYFNFSAKSDPFLIYPSQGIESQSDGKQVLFISKNLVERVRNCEIAIIEESSRTKRSVEKRGDAEYVVRPEKKKLPRFISPTAKEKEELVKLRRYIYSAKGLNKSPSATPGSTFKLNQLPVHHEASSSDNNGPNYRPDSPIFASDVINMLGNKESLAIDQFDSRLIPNKELEEQKQPKAPANRPVAQEKSRVQGSAAQEQKPKEPKVFPLDVSEDDLPDVLERYFAKADPNLQRSLLENVQTVIDECNVGQDPRWFYLIDGDKKTEPIGFAAINISNSVFTSRRLQIVYFSTTSAKYYDECLKELIKYLWKEDSCQDIWLGLFHIAQPNGNLGIDKVVEELLKANGFRWKRVTNDPNTEKRKTEYAIKRPDDVIADVKAIEQISIDSSVILSGHLMNTGKEVKDAFDSRYAIISTLLHHCEQRLSKFTETENKKIQQYLKLISQAQAANPDGWLEYGIMHGKTESFEELKRFISEKLRSESFFPNPDPKIVSHKFSCSLMSVIYRWKSYSKGVLPLEKKNVSYMRINYKNSDILEVYSKKTNAKVLLIPTDDPDVNVFVIDSEELIKKTEAGRESLEDTISNIFNTLEKEQRPVEYDIWIPAFQIAAYNQDLPEVTSCFKPEYKIATGVTSYSVKVGVNSIGEGILKISPAEDAKILKGNFIFGIMHNNSDIPLFASLIKENHFVTAA